MTLVCRECGESSEDLTKCAHCDSPRGKLADHASDNGARFLIGVSTVAGLVMAAGPALPFVVEYGHGTQAGWRYFGVLASAAFGVATVLLAIVGLLSRRWRVRTSVGVLCSSIGAWLFLQSSIGTISRYAAGYRGLVNFGFGVSVVAIACIAGALASSAYLALVYFQNAPTRPS